MDCFEAVEIGAKPFLGICVGMQMMASRGHEFCDTPGLDWIKGEVVEIKPKSSIKSAAHGLERGIPNDGASSMGGYS